MNSLKTLQFISRTAGRTKFKIGLLVLLQAVIGLNVICYALFLRDMINSAAQGREAQFFRLTLAFACLIIFQMILRFLLRSLEESTRAGLENRFKENLFDVLLKKDYSGVSSVHSEEWMNRLTSDTVVVANGLTDILPGAVSMIVKLTGAAVMIVWLEPVFLYFIVPLGLLMFFLSYACRKRMKNLHREMQETDGRLRVSLSEYLGSMIVVRAYGAIQTALEDVRQRLNIHYRSRMKKNRFSNVANTGLSVIMNGAYLMAAFVCGYGILKGTMSYGTFTAVIQLVGQIQAPFANLSSVVPRYYSMLASAERLTEAEGFAEQNSSLIKSIADIQSVYENGFEGIGLSEVNFAYPDRDKEQVLDGFSMFVGKGEFIAVTGPSGCGKSTVLKLLMGLYEPNQGNRYMQIQGMKKNVDASWKKLFAYVPQGNHLMNGSIREIVALSDKKAMYDESRLKQALSVACADEFVDQLDEGPDTVLGERGAGLSDGQLQRLSVARAVFSGYPVLLLDECTSALDEATQKRLLCNLRSMTDRTVIMVAHRKTVMEMCDRIIVFNDGQYERIK